MIIGYVIRGSIKKNVTAHGSTSKSGVMLTVNSRGQQSIMVAVVRLHRRKRKNVTYRVNWEVVSILFTPVSLLNF